MTGWTPTHCKHVGELIAEEIDRRAWSATRAAGELSVSTKTLKRLRDGTSPADRLSAAAETLQLRPEVYLPRPQSEQTQLDRIEAMVARLLSEQGIDPADVVANPFKAVQDVADAGGERPDEPPSGGSTSPDDPPGKDPT